MGRMAQTVAPDAFAPILEALAELNGLGAGRIACGSGSDELIPRLVRC